MSAAASPPAGITLRNVEKRFGNTRALRGLDLDLVPGEVLGIAGPNGAGKSTLMKILAGEEDADSGEILFEGQHRSRDFLARHIAVVHQEPQLFPNLTLAENLLVGREATRFLKPSLGEQDRALVRDLGIEGFAHRLIADCPLATQQRTEIGRALAREARVFLFDEPNSALTAEESTALFKQLHQLAAAGNIVILVTHRFEDLVQNAKRVAIIRDGRVAATLEGNDLTAEAIARQLVEGLETSGFHRLAAADAPVAAGTPLLSVQGWSQPSGAFRDVSFEVARGEVVALLGVEGSGAREFLRSLAGVDKAKGSISLDGSRGIGEVRRAVAYVAASRSESLFHNLGVGANLLARLGWPVIAGPAGHLKRKAMETAAQDGIRRFLVKTPSPAIAIGALSGGNQQKVAIAQAMMTRPKLLLLEEPTRGVDVGSKREIYLLLSDLAAQAGGVVMFTTELLEAFEAATRLHVFANGRLSRPIEVGDYDSIAELAAAVSRIAD